jgi:pimeloyl-ACP methyl ester carboxylesterase
MGTSASLCVCHAHVTRAIGRVAFRQPRRVPDEVAIRRARGVAGAVTLPDRAGTVPFVAFNTRWALEEGTPLVMFSHGNATDLSATWPVGALLAAALPRCVVVVYDYRGYGTSQPPEFETTEASIKQDAAAVTGFFAGRMAPGARVVLVGHSLGTGPACWLAAEGPTLPQPVQVAAVVLLAPFVSLLRVATNGNALLYATGAWAFDMFDNQGWVAAMGCPLYIAHGERDAVICAWHTHALAAAYNKGRGPGGSPAAVTIVPDADHDTIVTHTQVLEVVATAAGTAWATDPDP